jgi:hypothetical protein
MQTTGVPPPTQNLPGGHGSQVDEEGLKKNPAEQKHAASDDAA